MGNYLWSKPDKDETDFEKYGYSWLFICTKCNEQINIINKIMKYRELHKILYIAHKYKAMCKCGHENDILYEFKEANKMINGHVSDDQKAPPFV